METQWIKDAARACTQHVQEVSQENEKRRREEQAEQHRLNRIANDGVEVGERLWEFLQTTLKANIEEFNRNFGDTAMRPKALGNGTFEVHFDMPGVEKEKIAALTYVPSTTNLSWLVYGGVTAVPLTIGLEKTGPGQLQADFKFTNGRSFFGVPEISRQIISSLLP